MFVQFAKTPYSAPFKKWFFSHLFPAGFSAEHSNLGSDIVSTIEEVYEYDGVNISEGSYTLASDFTDPKTVPQMSRRPLSDPLGIRFFFTFMMMLFGLPSRPSTIVFLDDYSREQPVMYFKQFGLNLIGGWDSDPKISFEKKFWQWASLPIKIGIILPIKLLLMPIKFAINMIKLYTEWLPLLISVLLARAVGAYRRTRIGALEFPSRTAWRDGPVFSFFWLFILGFSKLPYLIIGTLYFSFRLVALIGRAITSPEKSIRMAFNFGREVKIELGGSKTGKWFGKLISNLIGLVAALISVSITAFCWIFLLPLGFSFISAHFPVFARFFTWIAQLPPVVATMTWFSQVPLITTSLGLAQGALTSLGLLISSVFGPAIMTMGAAIGLKISVGVMLTGTALALIGAGVAPALTKAGDYLSNLWASWTNSGPFTALFSLCFPQLRQSTEKTPKSQELMRFVPLSEEAMRVAVPVSEDTRESPEDIIADGAQHSSPETVFGGRMTEEEAFRIAVPRHHEIDLSQYDGLLTEEVAPGGDGRPTKISGKARKLGATMTTSVEDAQKASKIPTKQEEYHRPAQQGVLESAEDYGDYLERELNYSTL